MHWAAKRNHLDVAHYLLNNGADKDVESFAKELPADLATSPAVLNLLGSPKTKAKSEELDKNTFIPHYLTQPEYSYKLDLDDHQKVLSSYQSPFPKSESSESFKQTKGNQNELFCKRIHIYVFCHRTSFQTPNRLFDGSRLH